MLVKILNIAQAQAVAVDGARLRDPRAYSANSVLGSEITIPCKESARRQE